MSPMQSNIPRVKLERCKRISVEFLRILKEAQNKNNNIVSYYMYLLDTKNNTRYNAQLLANKYGKQYLTSLIKQGRFKPLPSTINNAKKERYTDTAIQRIFGGKVQSARPLSDFRKDTGRLKKGVSKIPLNSFLSQIKEKPRKNFTTNEINALQTIAKSTQRRIEKMQKKQIMDIAKLAKNNLFTNAITFNETSNPYVIPQNWMKGRRNVYNLNTLQKLRKPNYSQSQNILLSRDQIIQRIPYIPNNVIQQRFGVSRDVLIQAFLQTPNGMVFSFPRLDPPRLTRKIKSPFTREELNITNIMPLNKYINRNYKGKYKLLKQYQNNPHKTSKEIANLYQPCN